MLISRDNQICLEFAFWKSRPPVALGGIYEMRTYLLKVRPYSLIFNHDVVPLSLHLVGTMQMKIMRATIVVNTHPIFRSIAR